MHWQEKKKEQKSVVVWVLPMQRQDSVSCGGRAVEVSCGGRGETARAVEHAWKTLKIWERGEWRCVGEGRQR
jgi:hypothetical protein